MTCYFRHLGAVFEKAGIEVTRENKKDIDKIIHVILNVDYPNCPAAWKQIKKRISKDEVVFVSELRNAWKTAKMHWTLGQIRLYLKSTETSKRSPEYVGDKSRRREMKNRQATDGFLRWWRKREPRTCGDRVHNTVWNRSSCYCTFQLHRSMHEQPSWVPSPVGSVGDCGSAKNWESNLSFGQRTCCQTAFWWVHG